MQVFDDNEDLNELPDEEPNFKGIRYLAWTMIIICIIEVLIIIYVATK